MFGGHVFDGTDQTMDTYLMEFDMPRQKAEARMPMGSGFSDEFAPAPCMQTAAQSKKGETLASASPPNRWISGDRGGERSLERAAL